MNSSTSSSNATHSHAGWALAVTAALLLTIGLLRYDSTYASAPPWYWQMKVEWRHAAEIVLAGDSRVYRGLDPNIFATIDGCRTLNFGFSGAGYDKAYLDAVERTVDTAASTPTIVLGITPWSLTPLAVRQNGFTQAIAQERASFFSADVLHRAEIFDRLFRSFDVDRLWQGDIARARAATRTIDTEYIQNFHLNGWVASDYHKRNPDRGFQIARDDHANNNRIDPEALAQICVRVRQWRQRGWVVMAYQPPTPPAVAQLTAELSGFDEESAAKQLTEAGAIWVTLDPAAYESYDGSHLTAASAQQLSLLLARHLAEARVATRMKLELKP